jgi:hypothetical protein
MTEVNGVQNFQGWTAGMLYNSSRSHVRNGQPEYPNELDYCTVQGHDLKYSTEAWSATKGFLKTKSVHYQQMSEIVSSTILKYFNLDAYPTRDRGTFGGLIRFVDMHERFQIRIVSAQEHLLDALEIAVTIIHKDLDQMRDHETVMQRLIEPGIPTR